MLCKKAIYGLAQNLLWFSSQTERLDKGVHAPDGYQAACALFFRLDNPGALLGGANAKTYRSSGQWHGGTPLC